MRWRTARIARGSRGSVRPSSRISPPSIISSPFVQRSRVDLPEPDGPIRHTTSILCTCIETPARATKSPNCLRTSR
jgi:hypothetical protein